MRPSPRAMAANLCTSRKVCVCARAVCACRREECTEHTGNWDIDTNTVDLCISMLVEEVGVCGAKRSVRSGKKRCI